VNSVGGGRGDDTQHCKVSAAGAADRKP